MSGVRRVCWFLYKHSQKSAAIDKALKANAAGIVPGLYGPLPHDYDGTADIKYMAPTDTQIVASPGGEMIRQQVMVETIQYVHIC